MHPHSVIDTASSCWRSKMCAALCRAFARRVVARLSGAVQIFSQTVVERATRGVLHAADTERTKNDAGADCVRQTFTNIDPCVHTATLALYASAMNPWRCHQHPQPICNSSAGMPKNAQMFWMRCVLLLLQP